MLAGGAARPGALLCRRTPCVFQFWKWPISNKTPSTTLLLSRSKLLYVIDQPAFNPPAPSDRGFASTSPDWSSMSFTEQSRRKGRIPKNAAGWLRISVRIRNVKQNVDFNLTDGCLHNDCIMICYMVFSKSFHDWAWIVVLLIACCAGASIAHLFLFTTTSAGASIAHLLLFTASCAGASTAHLLLFSGSCAGASTAFLLLFTAICAGASTAHLLLFTASCASASTANQFLFLNWETPTDPKWFKKVSESVSKNMFLEVSKYLTSTILKNRKRRSPTSPEDPLNKCSKGWISWKNMNWKFLKILSMGSISITRHEMDIW